MVTLGWRDIKGLRKACEHRGKGNMHVDEVKGKDEGR